MNFFNPATTRPRPVRRRELSCSWFLWGRLKAKLRERGRNSSRESGAFLLGRREAGVARVIDFVLYDDLDPRALDTGIVRFDGRYFSELWAICKARGLAVVADIHVHPGGSGQSRSDREHPMISQAGHIALILPRYAAEPQPLPDVGVYRYVGGKQWDTVPPAESRQFFHISLF